MYIGLYRYSFTCCGVNKPLLDLFLRWENPQLECQPEGTDSLEGGPKAEEGNEPMTSQGEGATADDFVLVTFLELDPTWCECIAH